MAARLETWAAAQDDRGSAPAEFVMTGALLTVLALAVLQLAFAMHVRNTVIDAAAEGARFAALADGSIAAGEQRTRELIGSALSPGYARDITGGHSVDDDARIVEITVRAPLPLLGLIGVEDGITVRGRAPAERIADDG